VDFDDVFDAFYPPLRRYCHRLAGDPDVGDDVAQEAFVRLLEKKPDGADGKLRSWLFTVATHLIRDGVRVSENRRRLLAGNPVLPSSFPDPDESVVREERADAARRALESLDPRERKILLLREEGLSYREVAEAVGVAPSSVGTLLARARKRFAQVFREQEGWDEPPTE